VSRLQQNHPFSNEVLRPLDSNSARGYGIAHSIRNAGSQIAGLSIEFVAKPNEAQNVQASLAAAIQGALDQVAGFTGSFVFVANHEARLVTVITLWSGEDRMQRCNENLRWVRALVAPYQDRCLRVQTLSAYGSGAAQMAQEFEPAADEVARETNLDQEEAVCAA
jgi:hypothetical protein